MHVLVAPSESKKNKHWNLVTLGIGFLLWGSPMFGLGVFFPLGVLTLYRLNHRLRALAFQVFLFQAVAVAFTFPLEFVSLFFESPESFQFQFIEQHLSKILIFWLLFGLFVLFKEAQLYNKRANRAGNSTRGGFSILMAFAFSILVFAGFIFLSVTFFAQPGVEPERLIFQFLKGDAMVYFWLLSLFSGAVLVGRRRHQIIGIFRWPFASFTVHTLLSKPIETLDSVYFTKKAKFAKWREWILPGWGLVYLKRYWTGFPLLFIYLLLLLFTTTSILYYYDYSVGTRFLGLFQLKTGIPDKEFIPLTSNIIVPILFGIAILLTYVFSQILIRQALRIDNESEEHRGLHEGFNFNLAISVLAHLTLLALVFIIPISIQKPSSKKRDISRDHFQPEKMEFYFIDPEIPDEVKDLNGGVISGTETPSQNDGIKIPDEPASDEGKVKGYVKRIKGKKLPKTYSNYISARMRGPESFMDYWRRAPHPYSSVVAYTITTEGEIIDIHLVESSAYPDQDQLTLELIESMGPVMPPPGVKGDVRVTELFWNGSIDPDSMPTPLQKEMVLMFDGRYMEEEP